MDGFRDRFGSRYDRNASPRGNGQRTNTERGTERPERYEGEYEYGGRDEYMGNYSDPRRGRSPQPDHGSSRQLEVIQDYLEEAKEDRMASEKEILHAVDNNAKMIDRSLDILGEIKEKVEKVGTVEPHEEEDTIDIEELSHKNKEELLSAIAGNADLINALKDELTRMAEELKTEEEEGEEKTSLEDLVSGLEDHVHKESVKCYRNVLGAFEDHEKNAEEKSVKGLGTLKIFSIAQLALTVINLILLVLYIFGIM
ncbi:MAG: hypothetical protein K6G22_14780 [Lachnospiraceae bacterium]|nr:hypothetical protein [Lachnospiraceae bacterium]